MNSFRAGPRSSGLHQALGIGRLQELRAQTSGGSRTLSAVRALDKAAMRNVIRTVLMVSAAVLGFWGFQETVKPPQSPWATSVIWNNLFRTVQLLTTQFPNNLTADLPLQLQIARFAMPMFAVWFTATALLRRFNRPLLARLASLSRQHIVLVGGSDVSLALAAAYRRLGRPVVAITPPVAGDAPAPMELAGARLVFGDPTSPRTLGRAAVQRAAAVVAADDIGPTAVALAGAVARINERRPGGEKPLTLLIRLAHRELRSLMATQIAMTMRNSGVELKLYVRERAIARALLGRYPPDWGLSPGVHDYHLAIVGFGDLGTEILLQIARIAIPAPGRRTVITVIDRDAESLQEQLLGEHPGLASCAELRFITADVRPSAVKAADVEAWFLAPLPATAVYICGGDDHADLSMTIGLRRAYARLHCVPPPFFVHQRAGSALIDALPRMHSSSFDTLRVVAFGSVEQEADPFYLVDEEIDDLARLMHEEYLRGRERSAAQSGKPLPEVPAAAPWPALADTYRTANRAQADHLPMKLRILGLHATARPEAVDAAIDAVALEALAEQEHERWCRDRWLDGWVYAEKRDNALRHHPDLVPYGQLSETVRDLDRDTIRNVPGLLRSFGIGVRSDIRIGVWIPGGGMLSPVILASLARKVAACGEGRHLQLVLPLRSPAEGALVTRLARDTGLGIDVALVGGRGAAAEIGAAVEPERARELIAAADRAFVLTGPDDAGADVDIAALTVFCDMCDRILLAGETVARLEEVASRLSADRRRRVDMVSAAG